MAARQISIHKYYNAQLGRFQYEAMTGGPAYMVGYGDTEAEAIENLRQIMTGEDYKVVEVDW